MPVKFSAIRCHLLRYRAAAAVNNTGMTLMRQSGTGVGLAGIHNTGGRLKDRVSGRGDDVRRSRGYLSRRGWDVAVIVVVVCIVMPSLLRIEDTLTKVLLDMVLVFGMPGELK